MNKIKEFFFFEPRTIEEETQRDILSAVCFKYFLALMGALYVLIIQQPTAASGTILSGLLPLNKTLYWYFMIGIFGIVMYTNMEMRAKRDKIPLKIPFLGIAGFGIYVVSGTYLLMVLMEHVLTIKWN